MSNDDPKRDYPLLSLRLTESQIAALEAQAAQEGVTVETLVRRFVDAEIKELHDYLGFKPEYIPPEGE